VSAQGPFCKLTNEPLSVREVDLICREFKQPEKIA